MATTFTPTVAQIRVRMTSQTPHLSYAAACMALIKEQQVAAPQAAARTISSFDFIGRIPSSTWAKITAARQGASPMAVALDQGLTQLAAASTVVSDNPQLLAMLTQLVTNGVLTDAEKTQILSF
jgi:hypothetical protein